MKITYAPNPLYTTVELTDHEKQLFWFKVKSKELEERLLEAHFYLEPEFHNMEKVKYFLDPDYYSTDETGKEKSKLEQRVDNLVDYYISDLQGPHIGDCTCVPASCSKCHAEYILGIDTRPGLGKYQASQINIAFGDKNINTIDQAIDKLVNYQPIMDPKSGWKSQKDFDSHIPRWREQAKLAAEWLINYRDQHFRKED